MWTLLVFALCPQSSEYWDKTTHQYNTGNFAFQNLIPLKIFFVSKGLGDSNFVNLLQTSTAAL